MDLIISTDIAAENRAIGFFHFSNMTLPP